MTASRPDSSNSWLSNRLKFLRTLKADFWAIIFLISLYIIQGVPFGLIRSIMLILQSHNVSMNEQGAFSFANWSMSLKILWAPVVDIVYSSYLGKRKSWVVPCNYAMCGMLILLSYNSSLLDNANVYGLLWICLVMSFLAATQDIAVDGWAVTLLKRKGYASGCNMFGFVFGIYIGDSLFLILKTKYGVNISQFTFLWAIFLAIFTTLILIFKSETRHEKKVKNPENILKNEDPEKCEERNLIPSEKDTCESDPTCTCPKIDYSKTENFKNKNICSKIGLTYASLFKLAISKENLLLAFVLFTYGMPFSTGEAASDLKFVEVGVPIAKIAAIKLKLAFISLVAPLIFGQLVAGKNPLKVFIIAYPIRLLNDVCRFLLFYYADYFQINSVADLENGGHVYSENFYYMYLATFLIRTLTLYGLKMSLVALIFTISDENIGGTWVSLYATILNLGEEASKTLFLFLIDFLTFKNCDEYECTTTIDGYLMLGGFGLIFGIVWFTFFTFKKVYNLHKMR